MTAQNKGQELRATNFEDQITKQTPKIGF